MSLIKTVNGQNVTMGAAEEASMRAEWTANEALPEPVPQITVEKLAAMLVELNVVTKKNVDDAAVAVAVDIAAP